jgi:hypothetical protein
MVTFTDSAGKDWTIVLDLNVARRLRDEAGVDLLATNIVELVAELHSDAYKLGEALFAACVRDDQVSPAEFFARLTDGETLERALFAFQEALSDFSPLEANRRVLREHLKLTKAGREAIAEKASRQLSTAGESLLASLRSSDSTPDG